MKDDTPEQEAEGSIRATFSEIREEDGRRLAAVELEVDVWSFVDMTDQVTMGPPEGEGDLPEGAVIPEVESMLVETLITGSGLYLWDLEAGRLHSLELSCDVIESRETTMLMPMGPNTVEVVQGHIMVGTENWEVTCEG